MGCFVPKQENYLSVLEVKKMRTMSLKLVVFLLLTVSLPLHASTVAYWKFDVGPANTIVQTEANDYVFSADLSDVSGNGNHLSAWNDTPNSTSLWYRDNLAFSAVPQTGQANEFSLQNYGVRGCAFTSSGDSNPSGIDAEAITPAQFTVEAVFNPEDTQNPLGPTAIGTIVNRDAYGIYTSVPGTSSFSLRVREDFSLEAYFVDVFGYLHSVRTAANTVVGFDRSTDSTGLAGTWYHVAAVSDGSSLKLYLTNITDEGDSEVVAGLDLTLSGSPDTSLSKANNLRTTWHGGSWVVFRGLYNDGHGYRYQGLIDEVRISDAALTPIDFVCNNGKSAWNPTPEDISTGVGTSDGSSVTVDLGWNTGLAIAPNTDPNDFETISNPDVLVHYLYMSLDQNNFNDPTLYWVEDISASETTGEATVSLNKDGKYFWRIDEGVDIGGGTASGKDDPNTIAGYVWSFETLPTNYSPVVDAGEMVYTWLTQGIIDVQMAPTITDDGNPSPYTVLWEESPEDPNLVINSPTIETTTVTIDKVGTYTLRLTADDGELDASDTVTINVYADACLAAMGTPGYTPFDGDLDDDCDVDLADLSMLAANWLESTALTGPLP